jgi:hypothetical protein
MHPDIIKRKDSSSNIIVTIDLIFLIGWKQHVSQQKPKERGSANFSLKDVLDDLDEKENPEGKHSVKYGVLIDDGDNVREITELDTSS